MTGFVKNQDIVCKMFLGGKMKIKPLYDRVIIDPSVEENATKSGIVLPETSQERPQIGVVVAVGDGENMDNDKTELKVKIGDKVIFNRYAGVELKFEGKGYIVMRQLDIIGVVDDREDN